MDVPLLPLPPTPQPAVVDLDPAASVDSPAGVLVAPSMVQMHDLSREGPFDVLQDEMDSGATPRVLNSLLGYPYRMTSYDEEIDRTDLNPAYGVHLHDLAYWNTSGHPSRHACSAARRSTGCIICVGNVPCRPPYSFNMTRV